jgi:hypothetical protein
LAEDEFWTARASRVIFEEQIAAQNSIDPEASHRQLRGIGKVMGNQKQ